MPTTSEHAGRQGVNGQTSPTGTPKDFVEASSQLRKGRRQEMFDLPYSLGGAPPPYLKGRRMLASFLGSKYKLWEDFWSCEVSVPINPRAAERVLPRGVSLTDPPTGTLYTAFATRVAWGYPYLEAALFIRVRTLAGHGMWCSWMVVDSDTALALGRELLGMPKKMAAIAFERNGDGVTASVRRHGADLFTMEAQDLVRDGVPRPATHNPVRTFAAGSLGQLFFWSPVWMWKGDAQLKESYSGRMSLALEDSPYDPIRALVGDFENPLEARVNCTDTWGTRFMIPVGFAGLRWFVNTWDLRFR